MGRGWIIAPAMIVVSMAAAACGGDGGGSDATATIAATSAPASAIQQAAQRFDAATYRAEYVLTGEPGDQFTNGTLVWYKDGADRLRVDVTSLQDGEEITLIFVQSPDENGFCFEQAGELGPVLGVAPDAGVCFESDGDESTAGDLTADLTSIGALDGVEVVAERQQMVAGILSDCFQTRGPDDAQNDLCISDDGVLLYRKAADGSTFEATSVDRDVDDGIFALPFEVREPPGG